MFGYVSFRTRILASPHFVLPVGTRLGGNIRVVVGRVVANILYRLSSCRPSAVGLCFLYDAYVCLHIRHILEPQRRKVYLLLCFTNSQRLPYMSRLVRLRPRLVTLLPDNVYGGFLNYFIVLV